MTVKELRKFLSNMSDDRPVYIDCSGNSNAYEHLRNVYDEEGLEQGEGRIAVLSS